MANSIDLDQTPRSAASDQGLYCFLRPVFPDTQSKYCNLISEIVLDPPMRPKYKTTNTGTRGSRDINQMNLSIPYLNIFPENFVNLLSRAYYP